MIIGILMRGKDCAVLPAAKLKKKLDLRGASCPPGIIRKKKAFSHRPRKPPNSDLGLTLGDVTREMGRLL